MATNKYDQAAQAQFMNTYVPIPFEEMMMAGQAKQGRYDKASMAMDSAIAAVDEIQAIPNSEDERRAKEYSNTLRQIRDEYGTKDISDPFVLREMSNKINSSINKEDIKHIQQSALGYQAYNKGLAANAERNIATPNELIQDFTNYDSSSSSGVFTGTANPYQDPMQELKAFYDPMQEREIGGPIKEEIDGVATGYIYNRSGLTQGNVEEYTAENLNSLMRGPAMQQLVKVAKANGDPREAEEIAYEYAIANSNRIGSKSSNYRRDLLFDTSSSDNDTPGGGESEISRSYGIKDAEQFSNREANTKVSQLQTDAENGVPGAASKLKAIQLNMAEVAKNYEPAMTVLRQTADTAFKTAHDSLKGLGMSSDEAFQYLIDNSSTNQYGATMSSEVVSGRWKDLAQGFNRVSANAGQGVLKALEKGNPALYAGIDLVTRGKLEEKLNNMTGSTSKEQVLSNYKSAVDVVASDVKKQEKELDKAKLDAFNRMEPTQPTYTVLNGMWKFDGTQGTGVFFSNGSEKKYSSYIARDITNALRNPGDYQTTMYDEDNKELSGRKKNTINSAIQNSQGFTLVSVDNTPTENNGAMITMQLNNSNGTPTGTKFKIELPLKKGEDINNFISELGSRGQSKTAFNFANGPVIEAAINSVDVFNGESSIPLSSLGARNATEEDVLKFKRAGGATLIPVVIIGGETIPYPGQPVSLANLPEAVNAWFESGALR